MAGRSGRITRSIAMAAVVLLIAGAMLPIISAGPASAAESSEYNSGYDKAYPLFYDEAKAYGQADAQGGKENDAVHSASIAAYTCYTQVASMKGDMLRGACDGALLGSYNGYNAGYYAATGRTATTS